MQQPALASWLLASITNHTSSELIAYNQQPLSTKSWHSLQKLLLNSKEITLYHIS